MPVLESRACGMRVVTSGPPELHGAGDRMSCTYFIDQLRSAKGAKRRKAAEEFPHRADIYQ